MPPWQPCENCCEPMECGSWATCLHTIPYPQELRDLRISAIALNKELRIALARIHELKTAMHIIRDENRRAKREFTNVSNNLIEDACKVLDR